MSLSTQPYKGARDFYPEDKRLQKYMFKGMRTVAERFGYEEYDAPILEPLELYLAKSSQEIVDEQTYAFVDRGGRSMVIRPEMTPTVSRMIAAQRQELPFPMRLYSIPNLWRYERPQKGRLREHWQLNVDIFGVEGVEADHEIIVVADQIMKSYGARPDMYAIQLNSRKLTEELFGSYLGLDNTQRQTLIRLIDRIKKIPHETFVAQADAILTPTQRESGVMENLLELLKARKPQDLPAGYDNHASVHDLKRLMTMLKDSRVTNVQFDITLMRGFDYYTDIVFEVVDTDPENNRSMFGGGRYDGLVGLFGVEPVPTVGFGMGDVTLQNFLESHELLPALSPETDAYVILVGDDMYEKAQHTLTELRTMGVNLAVDTTGRKLEKQIKAAVKKGLHYALFIGEAELASEQYKLRNLVDGTEETHSLQRIVSIVKDRRRADEAPRDDDDFEL
jgi:histidyl-tRNA synthetase